MIYDVFRVTQLQRLPPRLGKGCLIVLKRGESDIDCKIDMES